MSRPTRISIPTVVRVKPGALDRLGIYLQRGGHQQVAVLISQGFHAELARRVHSALESQSIQAVTWQEIGIPSKPFADELRTHLTTATAIVGVGGGKALDVAKHVGYLANIPYYAVPTSLSNDGFCSPQSSLMINRKRQTFPSAIPHAVIIDTQVCLQAPRILTLSGIGDLVSKFTAVADWKLAFHTVAEPVNDFAALLSDSSIYAFMSHSQFDLEGIRLLATALLMNGLAMEMCGSSRPASGSEHLMSHALDQISSRPRLHGLQVGVATYSISQLHCLHTARIAGLLEATGFWEAIAADPFIRSEWLQAVDLAPAIKPGYCTILSEARQRERLKEILSSDPLLSRIFS